MILDLKVRTESIPIFSRYFPSATWLNAVNFRDTFSFSLERMYSIVTKNVYAKKISPVDFRRKLPAPVSRVPLTDIAHFRTYPR